MTNKSKEQENSLAENLTAVGQMILGEIEAVGGILTGDPVTRAEGEFNVEVGSLHQESNKVLTAIENNEAASRDEPSETNHTENKE